MQTIRATARAVVSDSSMAPWASPPSHFASSASSSKMRPTSYLYAKKRDRDCFEAYDYQAHMQQKMRYSALREQPQCYNYSTSSQQQQREAYRYPQQPKYHYGPAVYPRRDSLEHDADVENVKRQRLSPPASNSSSSSAAQIHKMRKTKVCPKQKRSTRARMTRKNYNKKKLQEMSVATGKQLQAILATSDQTELPVRTLQRTRYFRHKAEALDSSLRVKCNSIVQKERDIKAWLGMTTGKKEKIIKLRSRLHGRWAEVKDLQSEVKPKRQRLKNLRFAGMCEERSIEEEPALE